jgi:hypothetical protein
MGERKEGEKGMKTWKTTGEGTVSKGKERTYDGADRRKR